MAKHKKKSPPESDPDSPSDAVVIIENAPAETEERILLPEFTVPPTRNSWPENIERRPATVPLQDHEFAENGKAAAKIHKEIALLEAEKSAAALGYKKDLDAKETALAAIMAKIREGSSVENVECRWIYEYRGRREDGSWIPDSDGKTLVRVDTWATVCTGTITGEDRQTMLNLPPMEPGDGVVHSVISFPDMESFLTEHGYTLEESGDDAAPFTCSGPTGTNNINQSSRELALPVAYFWVKELVAPEPEVESEVVIGDEPVTAEV